MRKIRVLIVDDHAVLRAGLKLLIDAQADMRVAAEAGAVAEIRAAVKRARPDIVLMDITMPGAEGMKHIAETLLLAPGLRVLVLTMHQDPEYARRALDAGASGYLVKSAAHTEMLQAIRAVAHGETFVAAVLRADLGRLDPARGRTDIPLSRREQQVLEMIAQGHTLREIAQSAGISEKTIETYRQRVAYKLGLLTRSDFVEYALEKELLKRHE